jgi:pyruvate formate lyase activating enzyme
VRVRRGERLLVPFGYVARRYVRPVETNTIFHVRPGTRALSFGMYGCDLRCPYCHNHQLSQALREPTASVDVQEITARALVEEALTADCSAVCAAYNEPLITAEWAHAVFSEAKRAGLVTAVISDGHSTPEVLDYLRPVTDVFRIDLKGFDDVQYRALGGRLRPVLDAIAMAKALDFWVEVVTLVVPGFNQDARGLRWLGDALRAIDPMMPWHLDAFQPRYRMKDRLPPSAAALTSIAGTAYARGSAFVYVGNVPSQSLSATRCPNCSEVVIERRDWQAHKLTLVDGQCGHCGYPLPGIW